MSSRDLSCPNCGVSPDGYQKISGKIFCITCGDRAIVPDGGIVMLGNSAPECVIPISQRLPKIEGQLPPVTVHVDDPSEYLKFSPEAEAAILDVLQKNRKPIGGIVASGSGAQGSTRSQPAQPLFRDWRVFISEDEWTTIRAQMLEINDGCLVFQNLYEDQTHWNPVRVFAPGTWLTVERDDTPSKNPFETGLD